jgi:hydroxymethylpyrimidine pyrophosphatase-like HAD family hydrolase
MAFVIAVDYDGTIFEDSWPKLGDPRQDVIKQIKKFRKMGAEIVLWTCREGKSLQEALSRCSTEDLEFDAVNENSPSQKEYQAKVLNEKGEVFALRKIFATLYVDDRANGSIEYFLDLTTEDIKKLIKDADKQEIDYGE